MHINSLEHVDIVDEHNQIVGTVDRATMRANNLIHRCVYIFFFSPLGSLYVQQRCSNQEVFPEQWELAASGLLQAGEDSSAAALRKLGDEFGIYQTKLNSHGEFFFAGEQCKVWGSIYSLIWDGDITPLGSKISQWRYLSIEDIPVFLGTQIITPTTLKAYQQLLGIS